MVIHVEATGGPRIVLPAFATLANDAAAHGLRVFVEDPSALAQGVGRFEIELPNVEDDHAGRAAIRNLIDRIPGAADVFALIDR